MFGGPAGIACAPAAQRDSPPILDGADPRPCTRGRSASHDYSRTVTMQAPMTRSASLWTASTAMLGTKMRARDSQHGRAPRRSGAARWPTAPPTSSVAKTAAERRQRREVRLPGHHEPRDPHAHERHHGHGRDAGRIGDMPSKRQRRYAEVIAKSGSVLDLAIINDILDLSKIEAGKMDLESVPLDLCRRRSRTCCSLFWDQAPSLEGDRPRPPMSIPATPSPDPPATRPACAK